MEKDKDLQRLMKNLGFCFIKAKNYWYYKGDITIPNNFRPGNILPDVNIFIDGCLTINGSCYVGDVNAQALTVTGPFACNDLNVVALNLKDDLYSKDILVVSDMFVQKNVHASHITVDGTITVLGKTEALSIKAKQFCLQGGVDCTSLKNIYF